jgi:chaperonin GroEL
VPSTSHLDEHRIAVVSDQQCGADDDDQSPSIPENNDQKVGIDIVRRALQAPVRQIVENSGTDGSVVVGKLLEQGDVNFGFDAQTGQYVQMVKTGIIDPTKVVRLALQDASSVAGLLITTEAMVAEKPEKKAPPAMPGGGMGSMGDMDF